MLFDFDSLMHAKLMVPSAAISETKSEADAMPRLSLDSSLETEAAGRPRWK